MRKGDKLEKPKDKKGTLLKLGAYCARYWAGFLCAVFMSLFANLLSLTGPLLSGKAVDAIQTETGVVDFPKVFYYAGWMILCYIASAVLAYLLQILMITDRKSVV